MHIQIMIYKVIKLSNGKEHGVYKTQSELAELKIKIPKSSMNNE